MKTRARLWMLVLLMLVPLIVARAGGDFYDPLDIELPPPLPDDPPDIYTDPFDISDLPDPIELPFPPEDPVDFPLPDPVDFPDPLDIPDPFPDVPSLYAGANFGYGVGPVTALDSSRAAASNVLTKLMPFPQRLPFRPAYSGVSAAPTHRVCTADTATKMIVAEPNRNDVAFVDTCPYAITKRLKVGSLPVAVAGTPDEKFALVANAGEGDVSVIDISSRTVVSTIPLPNFNGFEAEPNAIAVLPDGSRAYVTDHDGNPGSTVYVIDLASRKVIAQVSVGAYPASIAATPDGSQVWVPCRFDSDMFVIDTLTNTVVGTNHTVQEPTGVAFTPNGAKAYVAEGIESGGYVDVIDTTTFLTKSRITVGNLPHVLAMTPSGHYLFVTNPLSDFISEIDTTTDKVIRNIQVGRHALGITFIH